MDFLYLNQLAQELIDDELALREFKELSCEERKKTVQKLGLMTHQSHPTKFELDQAIVQSGLKRTVTPIQMLLSGPIEKKAMGLSLLPESEMPKSFVLLLHLFRISDARRRKGCGNDCSHWWHQDLSTMDSEPYE